MTPGEFDDLRALLRRHWTQIGTDNEFWIAVCLAGQELATKVKLLDIKPHGLLISEADEPTHRGFLPASSIVYAIWTNGTPDD